MTLSLETILNQFWKSILTEAQAANMKRSVPAEFVSFCVGDGDFIYTVRKGNDVQTAQVKKLNALGDNILPEKVFGDRGRHCPARRYHGGSRRLYHHPRQRQRPAVQYDGESNLLFAFGGKGNQTGLAQNPAAVQALGKISCCWTTRPGRSLSFHRPPSRRISAAPRCSVRTANTNRQWLPGRRSCARTALTNWPTGDSGRPIRDWKISAPPPPISKSL